MKVSLFATPIVAMFAALLLVACDKEQPAAREDEAPAAVSFTFPNVSFSPASENSVGAVAASRTSGSSHAFSSGRGLVSALDAEKAIFPGDMDIFLCSGDQFVRKLIFGDDYTERNGDAMTIDLSPAFIREFIGQSVVFYFVANNASSVGGTHIGANVDPQTATATGRFEDLRTAPLGDSPWYAPGTKAELICTKDDFGNTYGMLMTGRSSEIRIAGKHSASVTLRRRAARFDIRNPAPTRYKIEEIYVSDAKVQAPMFGTSAADHSAIATRSLEEIVGPKASDYDAATNIAPCVFYLYPTDLTTTTIALEVTDLTANPATSAIFTLDTSGLANKKIEANTRYVVYFDESTLQVGLQPGDYNNP